MNIEQTLINTVADFFNKPIGEINLSTSKDSIEEWDSLEHLKLILEVESKFGIKFSLEVIPNITSVNAIKEEIEKLKNE